MSFYINPYNLLINLGGLYMSWEALLSYTVGGISSQFPSFFFAFLSLAPNGVVEV